MYKYIAKRLGISVLIMLLASVLMFVLTIISGDPLQDLRESNNTNRDNLMAQRTAYMGLDDPWYVRYWTWLRGVLGAFTGHFDLGRNRSGQSVNSLLVQAAGSTIRLVLLSVILAIVVGIFLGVMTAIRQYSGFDYAVTFVAFVLYSLPAFVFAVLLKEYGAIRFNNWLADPTIGVLSSVILALIFAVTIQALVAGDIKRRLIAGGVSFIIAFGILQYVSATKWFSDPTMGILLPIVVGIAAAILFTSLLTGLANRRALICTVASAVVMIVILQVSESRLWDPTWGFLFLLLAIGLAAAVAISFFFGGYAKRSVISASMWTVISIVIASGLDYMSRYWTDYVDLVGSRPISTIGSGSPNFAGDNVFWLSFLDSATHLLLPTISLTLISLASYTRYTRSAMLEVLNQDYVRTARAKGMPERTVISRHAFRNAMIPITTIIAFDFAGLIGGAVITETVFGWKGMGALFRDGLAQVDPAPVMAFFLVTGGAAILMNLVADIMYAYIDPRIRR